MNQTGRIEKIYPLESGVSQRTGNEWASQTYVLAYSDGRYDHRLAFNVFGKDKIAAFALKEGEEVNVFFDIDSREYTDRNGHLRVSNEIARAFTVVRPQAQPVQQYSQPMPQNTFQQPRSFDDFPPFASNTSPF